MERSSRLDALRARIAVVAKGTAPPRPGLSLGLARLDACLPAGRLAAGGLHGFAGPAAFSFVAFLLSRLEAGPARPFLWCRRGRGDSCLYPPGLFDHGLDPAGLVLVDCPGEAELLQSAEEGLRCPALTAVVAESARPLDLTASRRLQLAAQEGGAIGFLLLAEPRLLAGPASLLTAWEVAPAADGTAVGGDLALAWRLTLSRCRNGRGGTWTVVWNAEANRLDLVSPPADGQAGPGFGQRLAG